MPQTYLNLVIIMLIWGSNVIIFKVIVEYLPIAFMVSIRNIIAAASLILIIRYKKHIFNLTKKEWFYVFIAGCTGIGGHHYYLAKGLLIATASNTAIILALSPVTTAILSYLLLKDKLTKFQILGILIGFSSVFLLIVFQTRDENTFNMGIFYVLLSMLLQSFSYIFIRKVTKTVDPKIVTTWSLFIGGLFIAIFVFTSELSQIQSTVPNANFFIWILLLFSAIASSAIGQTVYNSSIKKIGTSETTIFTNLIPFFSLILSVMFLKEAISFYQVIFFITVIIGVMLSIGVYEQKLLKSIKKIIKVKKHL